MGNSETDTSFSRQTVLFVSAATSACGRAPQWTASAGPSYRRASAPGVAPLAASHHKDAHPARHLATPEGNLEEFMQARPKDAAPARRERIERRRS